jgi:hypothetical protein
MKDKRMRKTIFAVLIAFAVIAFWRGMWGLMDEYLFPNNYLLSLWVSVAIGLVILIITHQTFNELM